MTCKGFGEGAGYVASSGCMKSRIGIVILFFVLAIVYKWGGEEFGLPIGRISAFAGGILTYLATISFFGSSGIAFFLGLVGGLAIGVLGHMTWEGEGGGY